jgi:hypothetical protein
VIPGVFVRSVAANYAWARLLASILLSISASLSLCGILSAPAFAIGRTDIGTTGAQFLKVGVSPRLAALGEAYGALGNDAGAIFSNPAGLHLLPRKSAQFVHSELIADVQLNSIFYAHPIAEPLGTVALNYSLVDYGKIDRTVLNAPGAVNPFSTFGQFSAQDQALSIAYADDVTWWGRKFHWGMTAKILQQTIGSESANGIAYDAGILYLPPGLNYRFGAAIQNLGFLSKFRDEADPLPINVKLSAAGFFYRDKLRLAADANFPVDNSPVIATGVEFLPIPQLALRGGYRWDNFTSDFKGPSMGVGFNLAGVSLDYAYVPYERLGATHRFALGASWGAVTRPEEVIAPPPPRVARTTYAPAPYVPPAGEEPTYAASVYTPPPYAPPVYTPPPAAPVYPAVGVTALSFIYSGGPTEYAWISDATAKVLQKGWQKRNLFNPQGPWIVEGEYSVVGDRLVLTAKLSFNGRTAGTFEGTGDAKMPFEAWTALANALNGRLASAGVR